MNDTEIIKAPWDVLNYSNKLRKWKLVVEKHHMLGLDPDLQNNWSLAGWEFIMEMRRRNTPGLVYNETTMMMEEAGGA